MNVSKQDRNTAITIAIVLIVCTITLVAIGSFLWQLIAPGISQLGTVLAVNVRQEIGVDYNFATADLSEYTQSYIERPNGEIEFLEVPGVAGIRDEIETDAYRLAQQDQDGMMQILFELRIPSIDVQAPVLGGSNSVRSGLEQGFYATPADPAGEQILFCYREYFVPASKRSCERLGELTRGDEIVIEKGDQDFKYIVRGINYFDSNTDFIYNRDANSQAIKIVRVADNNQRLVILALPE